MNRVLGRAALQGAALFLPALLPLSLSLSLLMTLSIAQAGGKARPANPPSPRRVVLLDPIANARIEMPDGGAHDFGEDLRSSLVTWLTESGEFIVAERTDRTLLELDAPPAYRWSGSFVPAASVTIHVDALSFETGSRGSRMFYGFDERFRTPFNDGSGILPNEFPPRPGRREQSWFPGAFGARGVEPFNSRSGLDLGEEVEINGLIASLKVRHARYRSALHLRLEIDSPISARHETHLIRVSGKGFFYEVSGSYEQFSGEILLARRNAMSRAFEKALKAAFGSIRERLLTFPLSARIDAVLPDGTILIGTGKDARIPKGTRYELVSAPNTVLTVAESLSDGAMGNLAQGDSTKLRPNELLREVSSSVRLTGNTARSSAASATGGHASQEQIMLPDETLGSRPSTSLGFLGPIQSLIRTLFLPYRIWRYFMYDQIYHAKNDGEGMPLLDLSPRDWAKKARREPWARQIGLTETTPEPIVPLGPATFEGPTPLIAVIDSGVDYNHPVLHDVLWLNPTPSTDPQGRKDRYGWDFISGDSRPFDDGYHGTEVASVVQAVAPGARILPLKVFNPWGVTSSATIYGAFQYALSQGAKILLCAWSTPVQSLALEMGIEEALRQGALVVTVAEDEPYPAILSDRYSNLITVAAVRSNDRLISRTDRASNRSAHLATIAAPGEEILVASPRLGQARRTSTHYAAAMVAGALARQQALLPNESSQLWQMRLKEDAKSIPTLMQDIQGGLRLRIR